MKTTKWSLQRQIIEHDIETSESPAIAIFNGKTYMVWRGRNSDNLWYSFYDVSTETWCKQIKIDNNYTSSAPAITEFKGKLYLAYRGKSSDYLYYCTMESDNSWSGPIKLNDKFTINAKSKSGPTLACTSDRLFLSWNGSSGKTLWYSITVNGCDWEKEKQIYAEPEFGPSLAKYNETIYIAYRTSNDDIYFHCFDAISNKWSSPGKVGLSGRKPKSCGGPALIADNNKLYLMFRDFSNYRDNIWYMAFDGQQWLHLIDLGKTIGAKTSKRVGLVYNEEERNILMVWKGSNSNSMWQSQCYLDQTSNTEIYAHKGNVDGINVNNKENTIDAIKAAILSGVDGVEFDVQQASDGLIVHHDKQKGTIAEIKKRNPNIPTLEEVLNLKWGDTSAIIELKKVNKPIEVVGLAKEKDVNFSIISFNKDYLKDLNNQSREYELGYLIRSISDLNGDLQDNNLFPENCSILIKNTALKSSANFQQITDLVNRGYKIGLWTVDGIKDLESYLLNKLVSIIITNTARLVVND